MALHPFNDPPDLRVSGLFLSLKPVPTLDQAVEGLDVVKDLPECLASCVQYPVGIGKSGVI